MDSSLQRIFQSYLLHNTQIVSIEQNIDTVLEVQKIAIMMSHLPIRDLISIKQVSAIIQNRLNVLFQEKMLDASEIYITVNNIVKYSRLKDESSLIIKDTFNAAKGYFDYRQKNYEDARKNLQIALESCTALINQYNYDCLRGRPIHLACNLVKVEACSGNNKKAIKIACYLISNIEGNCDNSVYKDINLLKPVQHLSFKNESFLLTQIFEEVAKLLASCEKRKSDELIYFAANLLKECNLISNKQFYREYTWFENKKVLAEGKTVEFLERASIFLAEGRGSCKLLWHATVLDVLKICQNIDSEISRKLQKQITEDFSMYKYLSSILKI